MACNGIGRYFIRGGQMSDEDRTAEFKQIGESKIPEQRIAEVYTCIQQMTWLDHMDALYMMI
jgi:hypothetical protein